MKLLECLPFDISQALTKHYSILQELRLRSDSAIRVKLDNKWFYLCQDGQLLSGESSNSMIATTQDITQFILNACNKSVYSVERQLNEGYLTLSDGCRIGVAGPVSVDSKGNIICFNTYRSLCIRVARSIACSQNVIPEQSLNNSILVVGKPSSGKTTFLRDLCRRSSLLYNVVVVDERGELCGCLDSALNNADVLEFINKSYALNVAVRSLSPDILAMDELSDKDIDSVATAISSGVKIYATLHGNSFDALRRLQSSNLWFDMYVFLGENAGEIANIYYKKDIHKLL